jgi:serine/threonine protein phosphatase PrpC
VHLALDVGGRTDIGCIRESNEDSFGYDREKGIFVVCDGMGGAAAGEVASQIGVACVLAHVPDASRPGKLSSPEASTRNLPSKADVLTLAIQLANDKIRATARGNPRLAGMGTTIVATLVRSNTASIAHVGDSRIYLLRDGSLQQLTTDHSLVMEHVRLGFISQREAETSNLQNVVTRALGTEDVARPDLADVTLRANDVLLLCTDGLTRHVSDGRISELIINTDSADSACNALIEEARAQGASDNITCVLIRCVPIPWYWRLFGTVLHFLGRTLNPHPPVVGRCSQGIEGVIEP